MEDLSNKSQSHASGRKGVLFTVFVVCAIGYVLFLLYQAVYFNYTTNQKIKVLKEDKVDLEKDQSRLETLIAYYKTDAFAELEARKKLGLRKPGEKVINVDVPQTQVQQQPVFIEKDSTEKSNVQSWIDYLAGLEN